MNYTNDNRGKIQYRERKRQIINFSGLKYNNITPTDIDGYIEYRNESRIYYEFKYKDAKFDGGQKLALERQVDDMMQSGHEAVLLLCRHEVDDVEKDVDAANTPVDKYYYNKQWYPGDRRTAKEITDAFMAYTKKKKEFIH